MMAVMVIMAVVVPVMHVLLHVVLKLTMLAVPGVAGRSAQKPLQHGSIKHIPPANLLVLWSLTKGSTYQSYCPVAIRYVKQDHPGYGQIVGELLQL